MAWLSRNNFTASDFLQASDLNNLANDIRAWGGNVNGGGYTLANVVIQTGSVTAGMPDPTTTLGDLIVRGSNPPPTRLGVGSNGQILVADNTQPLGMHWANLINLVPVTSVFGRTGTVVAQAGDYSVGMITGALADPTTTKGDLLVRGPAALNRIGVGTDGFVLTADSTQTLGVKWAANPGLVSSVFGRTGAVVASAGDYTVAQVTGAVPNTIQIVAGTGLGGGGPLTANVTLTANVVSVFGRTGAVVLTAPDISGVAVPVTRQVLAGAGLTGGGPLSTDVTLTAAVTSVFGRTGAVTLTAADITGVGAVLNTTQVIAGTGLSGGGALTGNVTLNQVAGSVNQLVYVQSAGTNIGLRPTVNFISTGVVSLTVADNSANNRVDVTFGLASTAVNIQVNGTTIGTRPTIDFVASSNVTISGSDDSTNNRVLVTIAATGGTGGGGSQTPWLQDVDAGTFALYDVNYVSVNKPKDTTARISVTTGTEDGLKIVSSSAAGQGQVHLQNSDGSAHLFMDAWGPSATTGPPSTAGLNTTGPLVFLTNNTEAARILTSQRILVGTTTDDGTSLLQVNGVIKSNTGGIKFPDNTIQTTAAVTGLVDPTTTKGDLIVHGATTTRLPVGTDNFVLTADSTVASGISWKAAAAGGVSSFNTRTGAVVPASGDYTAAMVTGAVPNTVQVIAGTGLSGGGALSGNVTLNANVTSVFGRTGAVVGALADYSAFYVPLTRNVNTGVGLSGGGALSADLTLVGVAFKASGSLHASGDVPDPGSSAGTTRFLREDATWVVPPSTSQTPWTSDINANTFRLYNASRVIINSSFDDGANPLQVLNSAGNGGVASIATSAAVANPGARFYGYAARGSQAAPVALAAGDGIAYFVGLGYGTSYVQAAMIGVAAEAAFSATSAPAYMAFATTPSGSTTVAERMRISSAGNVGIGTGSPGCTLEVAGMIRSTGVGTVPTSGSAADMFYNPGAGRGTFHAYNYGSSAYLPLGIQGNPLCLNDQTPGGAFVGIGTSSPTTPLTVAGDITVYRPGTPTTGAIFFNSAGSVYLWYNGTQWVFSPPTSNLTTAIGGWSGWTPTVTDGTTTLTTGSMYASYVQSGTVLFIEMFFTVTGPGSQGIIISLPITVASLPNNAQAVAAYAIGGTNAQNLCIMTYSGGTTLVLQFPSSSVGLTLTIRVGGTLRIS